MPFLYRKRGWWYVGQSTLAGSADDRQVTPSPVSSETPILQQPADDASSVGELLRASDGDAVDQSEHWRVQGNRPESAEAMKLEQFIFTPKASAKGTAIVRDMTSIKQIGIEWSECAPPDDFWKLHDAGEFNKQGLVSDGRSLQLSAPKALLPCGDVEVACFLGRDS